MITFRPSAPQAWQQPVLTIRQRSSKCFSEQALAESCQSEQSPNGEVYRDGIRTPRRIRRWPITYPVSAQNIDDVQRNTGATPRLVSPYEPGSTIKPSLGPRRAHVATKRRPTECGRFPESFGYALLPHSKHRTHPTVIWHVDVQ